MTTKEAIHNLFFIESKSKSNTDKKTLRMARNSLVMWDKVVELINSKYDYILKATKYGNKDAAQQEFSYSNVLMYEVAAIIEDILDDIEEYKQEIEK